MKVVGYADKLSVEPGAAITFMVSSEPGRFSARLIRLIHGDTNPAGPGYKDAAVESTLDGEYDGGLQELRPGSYIRAAGNAEFDAARDLTLQMWICPTLPEKTVQTIIAKGNGDGFALRLEEGRLTLRVGSAAISVDQTVRAGQWYFVSAAYDSASGAARLALEPSWGVTSGLEDHASATLPEGHAWGPGDFLIAAETTAGGDVGNFYNGKIDAPKIFRGCSATMSWQHFAMTTHPRPPMRLRRGISRRTSAPGRWSMRRATAITVRSSTSRRAGSPAATGRAESSPGNTRPGSTAPSTSTTTIFPTPAGTRRYHGRFPPIFAAASMRCTSRQATMKTTYPSSSVPPLGRPTAKIAILLPRFQLPRVRKRADARPDGGIFRCAAAVSVAGPGQVRRRDRLAELVRPAHRR